ncbi:hypothetical protein BJ322DRAFT_1110057 [Thelephora terrestris]|uniref:Uncharacterized protein n=1 Tax=Thelephora terrestris TaxID=56493 RepID=A0A9P6HAS9_9AGAM|nr:hypothetical protein BJ322DRAFT_1110057 [Thelephora terrestris]
MWFIETFASTDPRPPPRSEGDCFLCPQQLPSPRDVPATLLVILNGPLPSRCAIEDAKESVAEGRTPQDILRGLLQLLELPEDSARVLVENFRETKFVLLCGSPKFMKQVGFFELLQQLVSENEAHEELDSKTQLGLKGPGEEALCCEVTLINDHDPSLLPSLIRRVDSGQPRWNSETRSINGHGPS